MDLQTLVSSKKILIVFAGSILLVVIIAFVLLSTPQTPKQSGQITFPTLSQGASPLPAQPTVPAKNFTIQYPTDWQPISSTSSSSATTYLFTVNSRQYQFVDASPLAISKPGGDSSLLPDGTSIQETTVLYGGIPFLRDLFSANGNPFLITATPQGANAQTDDSFSMYLPNTNTQNYIDQFDQVLNSLHFK